MLRKQFGLLLAASVLCAASVSGANSDQPAPVGNAQSLVQNPQTSSQAELRPEPEEDAFDAYDDSVLDDMAAAASELGQFGAPIARLPSNIYHSTIEASIAAGSPSGPLATSAFGNSQPAPAGGDLATAAGHHHGHHYGKYYEYREVPKKKTWKFGYKRGNHKHTISRHEHGKAGKHPHFKTKVKWHDKKSKGKGVHLWDYNHHDKKHHYG